MSETFNVEVVQQDPTKVFIEEQSFIVEVELYENNDVSVQLPGPQGAVGPTGPVGATGPTGPPATRSTYTQTTPSTEWVINHNLGGQPIVTVVDFAGTQVIGDVKYTSPMQIVIEFTAPLSGTANFF